MNQQDYQNVLRKAFEDELEKIAVLRAAAETATKVPAALRTAGTWVKNIFTKAPKARVVAPAARTVPLTAKNLSAASGNLRLPSGFFGEPAAAAAATKAVAPAVEVAAKAPLITGKVGERYQRFVSTKQAKDAWKSIRQWAFGKGGGAIGRGGKTLAPFKDLGAMGKLRRGAGHVSAAVSLPARASWQTMIAPYNVLTKGIGKALQRAHKAPQAMVEAGVPFAKLTGGQKAARISNTLQGFARGPGGSGVAFRDLPSATQKLLRGGRNVGSGIALTSGLFYIDEPVLSWAGQNIPGFQKLTEGMKKADIFRYMATDKGQEVLEGLGASPKTAAWIGLVGAASPSQFTSDLAKGRHTPGDPRAPIASTPAQLKQYQGLLRKIGDSPGDTFLGKLIVGWHPKGRDLVNMVAGIGTGLASPITGRSAPKQYRLGEADVTLAWDRLTPGQKQEFTRSPVVGSGMVEGRNTMFDQYHKGGKRTERGQTLYDATGVDVGKMRETTSEGAIMELPIDARTAARHNHMVDTAHSPSEQFPNGRLVGVNYDDKGKPTGLSVNREMLNALGLNPTEAIGFLNQYVGQPTRTAMGGPGYPMSSAGVAGGLIASGTPSEQPGAGMILEGAGTAPMTAPPFSKGKWDAIHNFAESSFTDDKNNPILVDTNGKLVLDPKGVDAEGKPLGKPVTDYKFLLAQAGTLKKAGDTANANRLYGAITRRREQLGVVIAEGLHEWLRTQDQGGYFAGRLGIPTGHGVDTTPARRDLGNRAAQIIMMGGSSPRQLRQPDPAMAAMLADPTVRANMATAGRAYYRGTQTGAPLPRSVPTTPAPPATDSRGKFIER